MEQQDDVSGKNVKALFRLENVTHPHSRARELFIPQYGNFLRREVQLGVFVPEAYVTRKPIAYPYISVYEIKESEDGPILRETISANDFYVMQFELFLKENSIDVPAFTGGDIPDEFRHYFTVPRLTLIHGQDCTLRMIPPELMERKLREVEEIASYTVEVYMRTTVRGQEPQNLMISEQKTHPLHYIFIEND